MSAKNKVKTFMSESNRPYSANDIQENLKDISKDSIKKCLEELVEEKLLLEKIYGKQKIYCVVQTDSVGKEGEENEELDRKLAHLNETLKQIETDYKNSESSLRLLLLEGKTDDVESENKQLQEDILILKEKLKIFQENYKPVDKTELKHQNKRKQCFLDAYKKRKRICRDIIDQVLEGYPKTKVHLYQEIGIEEDPKDT